MATKTINIVMHSSSWTPTAAGWNKIPHASTGTFALNFSDGSASPFSLVVTTASTSNLNNSAYAAGDKHGIPQDVIKGTGPYVSSTPRAMSVTKSSGDNTITTMGLWGASAANDAVRATRWTVGSTTYDHDARNYGDAAPTNVDTSLLSYPITINAVKTPSASFGYPNVLIFTVNIPEPAQVITDVNGGNPIRVGSTGNTATITGAPSAATGGTFGGEPITVTGWNSGTGVATFTMPGVVDGEVYPDISGLQTLTITGSGWSASLPNVQLSPPVGSTAITVASPDNVDQRKLGYHIINNVGITPVNGDKFYGVDAHVTWAADLGGTAASLPITTPVVYWDASTGIGYTLNVTILVDGLIVVTRPKLKNSLKNSLKSKLKSPL